MEISQIFIVAQKININSFNLNNNRMKFYYINKNEIFSYC